MTTNSPNPVDGDVQALIADCQADIAELEKRLTTWGAEWIPYLQSKLKRQEVALAALTAEPVAFITEKNLKSLRKGLHDCFVKRQPVMVRPISLYTTPPAQLLRPVEFPDIEENEAAFKAGLNSLVDCLEDCGDAEQGLRLALRSISEKWQEVKS